MPTNHHRKSEAGVSLMLAVLVLSAITAIAFSLAAIILVEIRTSGDVTRTEPTLYANLGVTEEAFFQYKRGLATSDMDVTQCTASATTNICTINGVSLNSPTPPTVRSADVTPKVDVVYANTKNVYQLYEVSNFNKQFSKVTVDYLQNGATGNLAITIRKTDSLGVVTYPRCSPNSSPCSETFANGSPQFSFTSFDLTGQYDLILENQNVASGDNIVVSISTYDPSNSTLAKGMPIIGQKVLDLTARYLGLSRKYTIRVPTITGISSGSLVFSASADFSSTQGYQNWYYLSGSGAQMTWDSGNNRWVGDSVFHLLWSTGAHPSCSTGQTSVRRWTAPSGSSITITGSASRGNPNSGLGNGVNISINKNGSNLWSDNIGNTDYSAHSYNVFTTVNGGDNIDFVLNGLGDCNYDGTNFNPTITLTP